MDISALAPSILTLWHSKSVPMVRFENLDDLSANAFGLSFEVEVETDNIDYRKIDCDFGR